MHNLANLLLEISNVLFLNLLVYLFVFLFVLKTAEISISLLFLMYSSSPCIDASILILSLTYKVWLLDIRPCASLSFGTFV